MIGYKNQGIRGRWMTCDCSDKHWGYELRQIACICVRVYLFLLRIKLYIIQYSYHIRTYLIQAY